MGDRLLVQPLAVETTVGGMIRPGADSERPAEGIVVLVGPGRFTDLGHRIPVEIAEGDLISFPSYAGKEIVDPRGFAEGTYLIVRQDEVQINYGHHLKHLLSEDDTKK